MNNEIAEQIFKLIDAFMLLHGHALTKVRVGDIEAYRGSSTRIISNESNRNIVIVAYYDGYYLQSSQHTWYTNPSNSKQALEWVKKWTEG